MSGDIYTSGGPFCVITLQMSDKIFILKRSFTTLIDVFAEVGDFMKTILTAFNLILSFIINNLYEKSIINNLFEFDLDRKKIIIKSNNNKNNIPKENISKKSNLVNPILLINQNLDKINDKNNDKTKNKINEDSLSRNKLDEDILLSSKTKKNLKKQYQINNLITQKEKMKIIMMKK